jgi:hypothetical protein
MYDGPATTPNVNRSLDDTLTMKYDKLNITVLFELIYNFLF